MVKKMNFNIQLMMIVISNHSKFYGKVGSYSDSDVKPSKVSKDKWDCIWDSK